MKFWIVTPSYNQVEWLRLCVASVADQVGEGVIVHHHVQDACSTDGTREFLAEHIAKSQELKACGYSFSYSAEKDEGMYDAINRGWKLAPDDVAVIAHLNCDEQYLPRALQTMTTFFQSHQNVDVAFADMVVIDQQGEYICHRRALYPHKLASLFYCAGFTATTFQRASVTKEKRVFFDTSWRNIGDKVWYNALHAAKCKFGVVHSLVSAFADTGENLNWTEEGIQESARYNKEFLFGSSIGVVLFARINALRRYMLEFFLQSPNSYSVYDRASGERKDRPILKPTGLWHKKR
jgi:glycosyltransferase involved in cell wall biosynthesis